MTVKGASPAPPLPAAPAQVLTERKPARAYGRHNPFPAKLLRCDPLNKLGSIKDTRFIALWSGQAAALSRGRPAAELVRELISEAERLG